MGDPGEKWDTEKMREHRNDWSLAADIQLLSYMQQFSQNLLGETHSTLKALDSLESQVATACVDVSNLGSRLWALSDTQFIENRVYDDDDTATPTSPTLPQNEEKEDQKTVVVNRLTKAIENGIRVLDTKFEVVQVPASDSEDEDEDSSPHSGVVLKPVNRYVDRRLPHLIGSSEFRTDDSLGLRDPASDEETDEFKSISDNPYDEESEDSDIESDQPKPQDILGPKENNIFRPVALVLPEGMNRPQPSTIASSLPQEDLFGETEDNLFPQPAGKFGNWQSPDLWAPDDDGQKGVDDNSSAYRPPSADSSVSSVPSSNLSETRPIKKTNEEFGKSGSGRQPVFVQEDQDDLFASNAAMPPVQPLAKKNIPTGGVRIFGADINPFPFKKEEREASVEASKPTQHERLKGGDGDDIFTRTQNISSRSTPNAGLLADVLQKKTSSDFFDENESEDGLFSSIKPVVNIKPREGSKTSNNFQSQTVASKESIQQKRGSLFGKPSEVEEEDDLFPSKNLFSSKTSKESLFTDDLFQSENEDLFSSISITKQEPKTIKSSSSVVAANPLASNSSVKSNKTKTQSMFDKDLFSDEVDLFGDLGSPDGDLFGSLSLPKKNDPSSKATQQSNLPPASKSMSRNLFDDNEDDLFGSSSSMFAPSIKPPVKDDLSISSKPKSSYHSSVKDDLFKSGIQPNEAHTVKSKQSSSKVKKALERRSLFESDSDDDLFSSPQGSLSSRKSLQAANVVSGAKDRDQSSSEAAFSKPPKTDFRSIFSDNVNDETEVFPSRTVTSGSATLFGEDKDLFYKSNVDLKTPDLFKSSLPESIAKDSSGSGNTSKPLVETENKTKNKESPENNVKNEAVNPLQVPLPHQNIFSKSEVLNYSKTDLFSKQDPPSVSDGPETKRPEPPKSLGIKPIADSLSSISTPVEDSSPSEGFQKPKKPLVSQKPSGNPLKDNLVQKDEPDGEILTPSSPSKILPGKLKANQLININTSALLPGAKPRPKPEQTLSHLEAEVPSSTPQETENTKPEEGSILSSLVASSTSVPAATSASEASICGQEEGLPAKSSLLLNVNKERVKIQGKRRPSSRRARQEAIRASSIEVDSENTSMPTPATSNLMSPSTDEEDLFSVPPLDVITDDVKSVSPKIDIFGTPTVLSPVVKPELPSSFVSTPFVLSQPPPLEEEGEDEGINQDDDLFGFQDNIISHRKKDKKSKDPKEGTRSKADVSQDLFGNAGEASFFSNLREGPPPLDDDDDDDELFSSSNKSGSTSSDKFGDSLFSVPKGLAKIVSVPNEPSFQKSEKPMAVNTSLLQPKSSSRAIDDSLFAPTSAADDDFLFGPSAKSSQKQLDNSKSSLSVVSHKVSNEDSLFAAPGAMISKEESDSTLFSSESAKVQTQDSLTAASETLKPFSDKNDDSQLFKANISAKNTTNDSLFHQSTKPSNPESLFTTSQTSVKTTHHDSDLYNKLLSDEALFGSQTSKNVLSESVSHVSDTSEILSDDSLFSAANSTASKGSLEVEKSKATSSSKIKKPVKKNTIFDDEDDELSGNLFSSGPSKKIQPVQSSKPVASSKPKPGSLFGDDDDDNDIFGSSTFGNNSGPSNKSSGLSSKTNSGLSSRGTKPVSSSSAKPVKLETKQTFSDPLLSNQEED